MAKKPEAPKSAGVNLIVVLQQILGELAVTGEPAEHTLNVVLVGGQKIALTMRVAPAKKGK